MTEAEWLTATDPMPMLEYLRDKASDRKLRLFAVECCHRVERYIIDQRCVRALAIIEQNVDGNRHDSCFRTAADNARAVRRERFYQVLALCVGDDLARRAAETSTGMMLTGLTDNVTAREATDKAENDPIHCAACAVWVASGAGSPSDDADFVLYTAEITAVHAAHASGNDASEMRVQTQLVRDIFGHPFRPISIDPSWLAPDVRRLAEGIYADRAFDRMPILADALQDAGCESEAVLNHCRQSGTHVRGCWVVDLLLGKN